MMINIMKIKNFNVINKVDILINMNNLYIVFRKDINGDIIKKKLMKKLKTILKQMNIIKYVIKTKIFIYSID